MIIGNGEERETILKDMSILKENGFSYNDISKYIKNRYNVDYSDDMVRYYTTRKNQPKLTKLEKMKENGITKKLILSDIHIPFNLPDVIDIVGKHADEIDEIIINGDLMDCAEISVFDGLGKIDLMREMIYTHQFLNEIEMLAPNIKKTLILGNHEVRWKRYLARNKSVFNELHSDNILKEVVSGFVYHDFENNTETTYKPLVNYVVINDWWYKVNDMICCHPISYSKVKGRVCTMAIDYFEQQGEDYSSIIIAHTHKQSFIKHYGKMAYESGCLCQPMEYSKDGKLGYTPQDVGYVLATFVDNKFDANETKLFIL